MDRHDIPPSRPPAPSHSGLLGLGVRIGWLAGLVLALSSFMGWYSGSSAEGPSLAVLGWNTGSLGKLVFFVGAAVVLLAVLRELGVVLPPGVPESLVVIVLGTLATVFVLIRVISVPDALAGTGNRAVGLWVALIAAVGVVLSGLLRAGQEL